MKLNGSTVTVGYSINDSSLQKYLSVDETNTFNYGVVAYMPSGVDCQPLQIGENGVEAVDSTRTIHAKIKNEYASVDFIISGFPQSALSLVMCMYVYDGDSITYLCGTNSDDLRELDSAFAITINTADGSVTKKEQ